MNKKINLIEKILLDDYYLGNIEKGSLKNQNFIIWNEGKKHSDLVPNSKLMREVKNSPAFNFVKDDGAIILNIKLGLDESNFLADMLNNKKDAEGYDLFRIDWNDDRDFRSEERKSFDSFVSKLESSAWCLKFNAKENNPLDLNLKEASSIINKALKLLKQAEQELK